MKTNSNEKYLNYKIRYTSYQDLQFFYKTYLHLSSYEIVMIVLRCAIHRSIIRWFIRSEYFINYLSTKLISNEKCLKYKVVTPIKIYNL
jgi:hypothetical protein